ALLNFPHLSSKPGIVGFVGSAAVTAPRTVLPRLGPEAHLLWWYFATKGSVAHRISFVIHQAQFGGKNRFRGAIIWRDEISVRRHLGPSTVPGLYFAARSAFTRRPSSRLESDFTHASLTFFPADPARDAEGSRDRLAPVDAPRRHDPSGSCRHLC